MFDHLSLGVADLDQSLAVYDATLRNLVIRRMFAMQDRGIAAYSDEGTPGIRAHYHPNYYAAYVRDPNGYKVEAVCQQA